MTWLANAPAGRGEQRIALWTVALSAVLFVLAALWAKLQLPQVWAFIPIYESALILSDVITAVLLFGQCRIVRSRSLLVLAGGYVFTAVATTAHALTFPGLFSASGLLGAGPQTTAWIYMFWHGGFPLVVIAYALMRDQPVETARASGIARPVFVTCALAIGAAVACTAWATVGSLPPIMDGNRYTPVMLTVVSLVWATSLLALAALWSRRRPFTVLDLWLAVVMCAWLFDIGLSAVLNGGRFDLGFYAGRMYGLLAANFVLARLLLQNAVMHAELLSAHAVEKGRAAQLQLLMQQLQATNSQLSDTNKQLEEQSRFKSEFLANMSHELRTPLNAVIGFSEMLKDGMAGVMTERQRTFAGHIYKGGHHLLALINDILDLSKIEAGKVDIQLERVPIEATVDRGADDGGRIGAQSQCARGAGVRRRARHAAGGSPSAQADRAQSGGQRGQVHARRRPGRGARRRRRSRAGRVGVAGARPRRAHAAAGGRRRAFHRDLGARHRHRHRAGRHPEAVQAVHPDLQHGDAQRRRHRSRAGDGAPAGRVAWRHGRREQPTRPRQLFHRVVAVARRRRHHRAARGGQSRRPRNRLRW